METVSVIMKYCKLTFVFLLVVTTGFTANTNVFYLSPTGSDTNPGTIELPWATLKKAAETLVAGQTAYFRSGTYLGYVSFNNSGTIDNRITYQAYPGENPIIDGSNLKTNLANSWNDDALLYINGNYLVFKGFEVKNAAGVSLYCSQNTHDNTIDHMHIHNGYHTGIYLASCSYHTISNNIIHDFYDYGAGGTGGGGDADGIGVSAGNTMPYPDYGHHIIRNNLVYNCSDDGIDAWSSNGNLVENNEVYNSGYGNPGNGGSLPSTWGQPVGDGNGFKMGSGGNNTVINNISYSNRWAAFDRNDGDSNKFFNNTAFNNPIGFNSLNGKTILKNNIAYKNTLNVRGTAGVSQSNSWDLNITNPNFVSIIPGSPDFLKLDSLSPAIDVGLNISGDGVLTDKLGFARPQGLGYDLGAYEYVKPIKPPPPPPVKNWAPVGAKWVYDHDDGLQAYLTTIESVKDTTVQGKLCKLLITKETDEVQNQDGSYNWRTVILSKDFIYRSNDTIFHYNRFDNVFYPLYLLNVETNDTVFIRKKAEPCLKNGYFCAQFEYVVDSISSISLQGDRLKMIFNSGTKKSDWVFNRSQNKENFPIIDKIGSTKFFFGVSRNFVLEGGIRCLRCYTDDEISYKANYWTKECDYLRPLHGPATALNNLDNRLIISPNPFESYFMINTGESIKYELYDPFGRLLIQGKDQKVNTDSLSSGVYLLRLTINKKETKTIKLIKFKS